MSEPIRIDGSRTAAGTGTRTTGPGTVATGKAASPTGQAGKPAAENPQANSKGTAKPETVAQTGPIVIEGGSERTTEFEPPKRGPGRPRGSRNSTGRKSQKQEAISVEGFTFILASAHTMLAAMTKNPAWEIADVEAKELASAIAKVQEQYPFTVDPKAQAWINLAMVAGMVYVPRVVSTRARKEKAQQPRAGGNNGSAEKTQNSDDVRNVDPQKAQAKRQGGPVTPSQLYGSLAGRG